MNSPPRIRCGPYFYQFRARAFGKMANAAYFALAIIVILTILYLLSRAFIGG